LGYSPTIQFGNRSPRQCTCLANRQRASNSDAPDGDINPNAIDKKRRHIIGKRGLKSSSIAVGMLREGDRHLLDMTA
jgi:hypothetical protein